MPEDNKGNPLPEDQNPNPGNEDNNIPDWMKEAGWGKDSGTFDESKPIFDTNNDNVEDDIVPADIPAWLEDAAPDGFSVDPNATPAFEGLHDEGSYITTGDLIPRFPPEEVATPSDQSPPEQVTSDQGSSEELPVMEPETPKGEPELDIPSWLKNLELDEDSQETAVAWLENMPEDLRATDEEIAASKRPEPEIIESSEPETLVPPVDELAWIDDIAKETEKGKVQEDQTQAELSEDLIASDLIPEQGAAEQIFGQEEIQSIESEAPAWLQELADDDTQTPIKQKDEIIEPASVPSAPQDKDDGVNLMPDWLSDLAADEPAPAAQSEPTAEPIPEPIPELTPEPTPEPAPEPIPELTPDPAPEPIPELTPELTPEPAPEPVADIESEQVSEDSSDIPDWLGEFESTTEPESEDITGPDWLGSVTDKGAEHTEDVQVTPYENFVDPGPTEDISETANEIDEDVSPLDETLNTQVPDWLSKIGEIENTEELESIQPVEDDLDDPASWLDKIDKPIDDGSDLEAPTADGEVMNWLEKMDEKPEEIAALDDLRESLTGDLEVTDGAQKPVELESAKYFPQEEGSTENLPDWLAELAGDNADEPTTLESAIRQSDHSLSEEENNFLNQSAETKGDNADWLAKLDLTDDEIAPETESPAIKVDLPEADVSIDTQLTTETDDPAIDGSILDRLNDPAEIVEPEVPQWLENLKKEEDPQETAILWLKQFVESGNQASLQDEIKRYTDELNPGDTVPKWMEDLKHEEDPQTTAMLWLEKLAGERPAPEKPKPPKEDVEAGWLAELDKEAAEQSPQPKEETVKEFKDTDNGWLADLEIDEKIKSEETELPDRSSEKPEDTQESDEPLWMKATSPLEGDFHTDELAGNAEKEVEIPAWLAGYGEGEEPVEEPNPPVSKSSPDHTEPDEYTWVPDKDAPAPQKSSKDPIDLNKAAISQLESILGISYQVAQGIVIYREKQGLYKDLKDLLNVPEITDEQTIEILKPEVFIKVVEEKPKPKPTTQDTSIEERMQLAEALFAESQIPEALEHYTFLIKKKKSIPQVIENLIQAATDNPVDISILKTLGDAYMRIDKLDEALAAYSRAEELLR